jgi:hypothetical protein
MVRGRLLELLSMDLLYSCIQLGTLIFDGRTIHVKLGTDHRDQGLVCVVSADC